MSRRWEGVAVVALLRMGARVQTANPKGLVSEYFIWMNAP